MKACLRKEGRDPRHYGGALNYLYEMCGYDIRKASVSEERDQETFREFGFSNFQKVNGRNPHKPVLYRCIGRFRWNGGYDCYLTDEELVRFTLEDQIEK